MTDSSNRTDNGLLLRTDIHTLFDLDLIGIEPERLQLKLHPALAREYGNLNWENDHLPARAPTFKGTH